MRSSSRRNSPERAVRDTGAAKIFRDGEIGKYLFALWYQHDPSAGDLVGQFILDPRAFEGDETFGDARIVDAEKS